MRALIRSGETDKVILFAQVSRNRELYIMAANYLQTREWHNDVNLLKQIILFYEKAKGFEQLSQFYASCAHYEIDECREFEKALDALHEAQRCLARMLQSGRAERSRGKERGAALDGSAGLANDLDLSASGAPDSRPVSAVQTGSAVNETALESKLRELEPHISVLQMFVDIRRYLFITGFQ